MNTANSVQSRSLRSWRTRLRIPDYKEAGEADFTTFSHPITSLVCGQQRQHLQDGPKWMGKDLSSASPVMLRRTHCSPRPRPLGGEFLQIAGQLWLRRCTERSTVQWSSPHGPSPAQSWDVFSEVRMLCLEQGLGKRKCCDGGAEHGEPSTCWELWAKEMLN